MAKTRQPDSEQTAASVAVADLASSLPSGSQPSSPPEPPAIVPPAATPTAPGLEDRLLTATVRCEGTGMPVQTVQVPSHLSRGERDKLAIEKAKKQLGIWSLPTGPTVEWID